jgi:hypothetical protein
METSTTECHMSAQDRVKQNRKDMSFSGSLSMVAIVELHIPYEIIIVTLCSHVLLDVKLCKEKVKVLGRQVKVVVKEVIMKEEHLG